MGPAVSYAFLGPVNRHLQGAGQDPQGHGSAEEAVVVDEPLLSEVETLADLSQHLRRRDADVVQMDVVLLGLGGHDPDADRLKGDARRGGCR